MRPWILKSVNAHEKTSVAVANALVERVLHAHYIIRAVVLCFSILGHPYFITRHRNTGGGVDLYLVPIFQDELLRRTVLAVSCVTVSPFPPYYWCMFVSLGLNPIWLLGASVWERPIVGAGGFILGALQGALHYALGDVARRACWRGNVFHLQIELCNLM